MWKRAGAFTATLSHLRVQNRHNTITPEKPYLSPATAAFDNVGLSQPVMGKVCNRERLHGRWWLEGLYVHMLGLFL